MRMTPFSTPSSRLSSSNMYEDGSPFHKNDKFDNRRGLNKTAFGRAVISVISNSKLLLNGHQ